MGEASQGSVNHRPRVDPRPRVLALFVAAIVLVRFWLMALPGYPPDLNTYKSWSLRAGLAGVETIYDPGSSFDYPPLYGYLLAPAGKAFSWVYSPEDLRRPEPRAGESRAGEASIPAPTANPVYEQASTLLSVLVKVPPLLFDLALAALLGYLILRYRAWEAVGSWRGWKPALLYLAQPAVLFVSAYWGQPDAVETFFILLALLLILMRRPELGWVAAALGLLMKPLAAPFFPLLALATLLRSGWRRVITGGLAGIATMLAGFLPFFLTGRTRMVIEKFISDIEAMPYTTVNGHNLWWLLLRWHPANEPLVGPLTAKQLALGAFGLVYLFILWWVWKRETAAMQAGPAERASAAYPAQPGRRSQKQAPSRDNPSRHLPRPSIPPGVPRGVPRGVPPSAPSWRFSGDAHWYIAALAVALSFFALSTHMHENHLFPAIAFVLILAGSGRHWQLFAVLVGVAVFVNCATHDLVVGDLLLSKVGGTSPLFAKDIDWYLNLPPRLAADWTLTRGPHFSYLEVLLSYGNSVLVVGLWSYLMVLFYRFSPRGRHGKAPVIA